MIEHVDTRAAEAPCVDAVVVATDDARIAAVVEGFGGLVRMTRSTHRAGLDRIAEVASDLDCDIVVNVQGDEPLLGPDMIEAVIKPFDDDQAVEGTMLAVPITDEETFANKDIVKLVHDANGNVLFTSRAPIPYAEEFSPKIGALRVGGIFGFRWHMLKWFTGLPESPLEIAEACDSNRIYDNGRTQRIAPAPARPYQSVDSPDDVALVEAVMEKDAYWGLY